MYLRSNRSTSSTGTTTVIQFEGTDAPQPVCPTEQAQFKLLVSKLEARFPALKSSLKDDENKAWFLLSNLKTTPAEVFLHRWCTAHGAAHSTFIFRGLKNGLPVIR